MILTDEQLVYMVKQKVLSRNHEVEYPVAQNSLLTLSISIMLLLLYCTSVKALVHIDRFQYLAVCIVVQLLLHKFVCLPLKHNMYTTLHKTVSWFQGIHKHTHTQHTNTHMHTKNMVSLKSRFFPLSFRKESSLKWLECNREANICL